MKTMSKNIAKRIITVVSIIAVFACLLQSKTYANGSANVLIPEENQYLELRAVSVEDIDGQGKQVIMELWGHNLQFKGFTVRFSFDNTKIEPSDFTSNQVTYDSEEYFKFEDEFTDKLDFFSTGYMGNGAGIEATVGFNPPVSTSTHIKYSEETGNYVDTGSDLLIGQMSFRMSESVYNDSWFNLEESENYSPATGIKIVVTVSSYYENQSTFRFTDRTASKDANLSNIVVSHGVFDDDPAISTYKTYALVPTFDQDTINYEIELLEYIDDVDIKSTLSDEKSTMTIKVPKRDLDNKLVYSGSDIEYEEIDLTNNVPQNVIINKLGEPDTIIKIEVKAEDTSITKEYTLTIKRPYGTIRGSIQLGEMLRDEMQASYGVYVEYEADCTLYKTGSFDWDGVVPGTSSLYDLDDIDYEIRAVSDKDDGEYEIYAIPGTYDLLIERLGFLANVTTKVNVRANETVDLGHIKLEDGDTDRSGIIDLDDTINAVALSDYAVGDPEYLPECDFGQKGFIALDDVLSTVANADKLISINELNN